MKPLLPTVSALALTCALPAYATCSTVRLAEPGWTDLAVTTGVTQVLLEGMGYTTESDILGIPVIYESMKRGDLDVFMGYWDPAMETYFAPYHDSGDVETIHMNLEGAKFTWAVPSYVYEAGVTDFADLAAHADKFDGKLYGIEPGSNELMLNVVAADDFGLGEWEVVESSEQGMLSQVERFARKEDWIVFLAWAPHPMNTAFDLEYLSGGDAYYGPNFGGATVSTQVRKGYTDECPEVAKLLTQLSFDVALESEGMGYILEDGMSAMDAARALITAHPDVLNSWLNGVQALDGKPALAAVTAALGL